ncbi:Trm112 family protein [Sphingobium sp. Z007]|uniref:Trm112 family protein n=1 Tax=Sphingobium sp. Z007 TaxID=627495 RepID=UPI000B49CACA|nr:Trm112 family protein [Sphingobium sp. Z007]
MNGGATSGEVASVDPWLLEKLVCPVTRTPLRWDAARNALVSEAAGLAFPVRDGVPVLVVREAVAV